MKTIDKFPFDVVEEPHVWIPMSDGVRLSARVWRPVTDTPVPAILEFLPYRKRDGTAERDALTHPYMAGHGYICVRVDMRGCGDSEGLFDDEYSPQELADGVAVVQWLADQPWCSGNVGMMGISWGGFNGLQIAALAPAPLKAVVSICSTVDRFGDDIHYKGGAMLGENTGWAATVLGWFALPPDPEIVGESWRDIWLERLENTPFLAKTWVQNQVRTPYWRHGSVCEDYSAIKAAVLSVGGWHDGYRNTIAHLVENLDAPVKGLVGPWNHKYPHFAAPGPRIDFLGEMLRWWDRWLKAEDNGAEALPDMRRWLMDSMPPDPNYATRPGRWIGDDKTAIQAPEETFHLVGDALSATKAGANRTIYPNLFCGQATGEYFPHGFGAGDMPGDQRVDDALSCCFETSPLEATKDIVGAPSLSVTLKSDKPAAQLVARLMDVHPDGQATLISHGVLNLRHRNGHAVAEDLPLETPVTVDVILDQCAYRVPAGHSLRLALSSSYWPYIWPEAELATLQVEVGGLSVPVRAAAGDEGIAFDTPRAAPPRETAQLTAPQAEKQVLYDQGADRLDVTVVEDTGEVEDRHTGLVMGSRVQERFSICKDDPCSAQNRFTWCRTMRRGAWHVRVEAEVSMTTDGPNFVVSAALKTQENGHDVFDRSWQATVPRQ